MKFVVPISPWHYIIGTLITASLVVIIGAYVLFAIIAIGIAIGFLYFLFKAPLRTIGVVLLLVAIKYWQIALITGAAILPIAFVIGLFKPKVIKAANPVVVPGSDAQPTSESSAVMSEQIAEQNRQRQIQIDADYPRD